MSSAATWRTDSRAGEPSGTPHSSQPNEELKMRKSALSFASLAALALSACATVGPDHVAPATPATAQSAFVSAGLGGVTTEELPDRWWQLCQDPALDRLGEDALTANKDIAVATANLAAARAALR